MKCEHCNGTGNAGIVIPVWKGEEGETKISLCPIEEWDSKAGDSMGLAEGNNKAFVEGRLLGRFLKRYAHGRFYDGLKACLYGPGGRQWLKS